MNIIILPAPTVCLPACFPASIPTLFCLPPCPTPCLCAYHPACLLACFPTYQPPCFPACIPIPLLVCLSAYSLACLFPKLSASLPAFPFQLWPFPPFVVYVGAPFHRWSHPCQVVFIFRSRLTSDCLLFFCYLLFIIIVICFHHLHSLFLSFP